MVRVSVIVPFYNAQLYIERCALSLLSQTLESLELIFVDDCSDDDSNAVLENVISRSVSPGINTRVIHNRKRLGVSESRRLGLELAQGEYIGWSDADDWQEPSMYNDLYEAVTRSGSDIAVCNYWKESSNHQELWSFNPQSTPRQSLLSASNPYCFSYTQWNQLIRRSIALHAASQVFPSSYGEDIFFLMHAYHLAQTICYVEKPLYHYNQNNPTSIMARCIFSPADWSAQQQNINRIVAMLNPAQHTEYGLICQWLKFKIKEKMQSAFPDLYTFYCTYQESHRDLLRYEYIPLSVRRKLRIIYSSYFTFWLYHQLEKLRNRNV